MRKIITVQDLIDRLMLVNNKHAELRVLCASDEYDGILFTPDLYDFSIIDYTDISPNIKEWENTVVLKMYR